MRLYPVAPFLTRLIPKTSLQLGPYLVPPGSLVLVSSYTMARDSSIFYNPDLILPERWGRGLDATTRARQAFASLPFGHGPRGCIGRRLVDWMQQLVLVKRSPAFPSATDLEAALADVLWIGCNNSCSSSVRQPSLRPRTS